MENGRHARNSRHGSDTHVSPAKKYPAHLRARSASPRPPSPWCSPISHRVGRGLFQEELKHHFLLKPWCFGVRCSGKIFSTKSSCTSGRASAYLHRIARKTVRAEKAPSQTTFSKRSVYLARTAKIRRRSIWSRVLLESVSWKGCDHTCSKSVWTSWCSSRRSSAS